MKHYFAKIGSILIAAMIVFASVSTAFAEDTLKINGAKEAVNKGDTVHFTLNLSDTREPVIGFEVRIFYDPAKLELIKGSVKSDTFDNLFYNEEIQGKIPLNWTDFNNPVNCADKTAFFSCDFKALGHTTSQAATKLLLPTEFFLYPRIPRPSKNASHISSTMLTARARRILPTRIIMNP